MMLAAQVHALEVRRRLMCPPNRIVERKQPNNRMQELVNSFVEAHARTNFEYLNPVNLQRIIGETCRHYGIEREKVLARTRKASIILPRHVIMYLAVELLELSLGQIAMALGRWDHTGVLHAHRKLARRMSEGNANLAADIAAIKQRLGVA